MTKKLLLLYGSRSFFMPIAKCRTLWVL